MASPRSRSSTPPRLLASQFATLEVPDDALELNVTPSPDELVTRIVGELVKR